MLTFRLGLFGLCYSTDAVTVSINLENQLVYQGPVNISYNRKMDLQFFDSSVVLCEFDYTTDNLVFPRAASVQIAVNGSDADSGLVVEDLVIKYPDPDALQMGEFVGVSMSPTFVQGMEYQAKSSVTLNGEDYSWYYSKTSEYKSGPWKYPVKCGQTLAYNYQEFYIQEDVIDLLRSTQQ